MNKRIFVIGATALAMLAGQANAKTAAEKGDAKFAELTQGRIAGEPRSCVSAMRSRDIEVIDHVGLSFKDGDTLWIARASDPRSLSSFDVPIIERYGSQLCKQDLIRTVDRSSQFPTGVVFLGDFVPYTKIATDEG